jgi:hypothetical protein
MVDTPQLGELQVDRGTSFRQLRVASSQLIEVPQLAVVRLAGRSGRLDLIGQGLDMPPVGSQTRYDPFPLKRQGTPQFPLFPRG